MSSDLSTALYLLSVGDRLYQTVGLFIVLYSTVGNLCNCFAFLCIPALNKHPNALFMIAASVGSLIFIDIGLSSAIIRVWSENKLADQWLFWCKIGTWLTYSSGCFSFMCSCFVTLGQYLITSPKLQWQRLITRFRAKLMICVAAILWPLIFIPLPIYYKHTSTSLNTYLCTSSLPVIITYGNYCIIIGYYFLPVAFIFVFFCLTWFNLRQLLRRRKTLETVVTRMMLIQMSILLMSGIPAGIYFCYILITQYSKRTLLRAAYEHLIMLVLTMFTFLTNGLTFWVYCAVSKTFRKHLTDFIGRWKFCRRRVGPVAIVPATRLNVLNLT
ncbi:unnamed protein product [Adineta ricciae]|uniref:G-protein coupled receptors family 1 profile domain-containing protein n=1 Tax=Adineta ricciae TaxID=249248 RepID=A0A815PSG9_ADIRI|nr:unnamed protein product [Adineta ricciae]CAF1452880.1 unnamed protein product [Adineta ricciae]